MERLFSRSSLSLSDSSSVLHWIGVSLSSFVTSLICKVGVRPLVVEKISLAKIENYEVPKVAAIFS